MTKSRPSGSGKLLGASPPLFPGKIVCPSLLIFKLCPSSAIFFIMSAEIIAAFRAGKAYPGPDNLFFKNLFRFCLQYAPKKREKWWVAFGGFADALTVISLYQMSQTCTNLTFCSTFVPKLSDFSTCQPFQFKIVRLFNFFNFPAHLYLQVAGANTSVLRNFEFYDSNLNAKSTYLSIQIWWIVYLLQSPHTCVRCGQVIALRCSDKENQKRVHHVNGCVDVLRPEAINQTIESGADNVKKFKLA